MSIEEKQPQTTGVSDSYRISLVRKGQFVRFPIWEDNYFFCVEAPPVGSDMGGGKEQSIEVTKAAFTEDGALDPAGSHFRFVVTAQAFVEKCMAQVTDFCVPLTDAAGNAIDRTYDAKNGGDNRNNREVYEYLRDIPECKFRTILNGAMDYVAGAGGQAQKDFEELFLADSRLLSTS